MNREDAQDILRIHPPGASSGSDAELAAAREQLRHDPELAEWWERHQTFDAAMRGALAGIPVPPGLPAQIARARSRRARLRGWRHPIVWAAAASVALLAGVWLVRERHQTEFAAFNVRKARAAIRDYRMELETNDLAAIRRFLASRSAPADYRLRPAWDRMPGLGCGVVQWRNQPVSMICLDRGNKQILWVFVVDPAAVPGAPDTTDPVFRKVGDLAVATWREGRWLYMAGAVASTEALKEYL
jgi:hypothetical protein